jgi:hypothetical protein
VQLEYRINLVAVAQPCAVPALSFGEIHQPPPKAPPLPVLVREYSLPEEYVAGGPGPKTYESELQTAKVYEGDNLE